MQTLSRAQTVAALSSRLEPALRVRPGELFCLDCADCFDGGYFLPTARPGDVLYHNPATGPVYVAGALPGCSLAVEIVDIIPDGRGVVESVPGHGPLGPLVSAARAWELPAQSGLIRLPGGAELPARPMIGVLGLAPAQGELAAVDMCDNGGNLDCPAFTVGSRVILPVAVAGGLLFAGDLHWAMGCGETSGSGLEIGGRCLLRAWPCGELLSDGPLAMDGKWLTVVAAAPQMSAAAELAVQRALLLLRRYSTHAADDLPLLLTLAADVYCCQMVNSQYSMAVRLPLATAGLDRLWKEVCTSEQDATDAGA